MSLVKLSDGQKFEVESTTGTRDGVLRQRERKILPLIFRADEGKFAKIKKAFADPEKTETITVYFPDEKGTATDEQLEGVAHKVYTGYTILGECKEDEIIVTAGTPDTPPEYARRLTIELGQRQYSETE